MSAQGEEVVVATDAFDAEQLVPQVGQQDFALVFGSHIGLSGECVGVWRRQGTAIELAVGGERQRGERHIGRRQHVVGQTGAELGA